MNKKEIERSKISRKPTNISIFSMKKHIKLSKRHNKKKRIHRNINLFLFIIHFILLLALFLFSSSSQFFFFFFAFFACANILKFCLGVMNV